MISFKQYLLEYLTDEQRARYKHIKLTPEAKANTDHFFGTDTDIKHEPLLGNQMEKSEVHKKVEDHLGQTISHEDYRAGVASDKYGRKTKIGKLIKDQNLQKQFVNDNTRTAAKKKDAYSVSIVRGTEVAGQTNSVPNKEHPNGHSWGEESCKNVEDGVNKRYLEHEIRHGSTVVRVHDDSGKEVYRATLHPYHNDEGNTMYSVNSEYGLKHPKFTQHAHDVATRLSGEHKGGSLIYKIHPDVYDDRDIDAAIHPSRTTSQDLHNFIDNGTQSQKIVTALHYGLNSDHIDKILNSDSGLLKKYAIKHPNVTSDHITKALNDSNPFVRKVAIQHPNATSEHITKALNDSDLYVRATAIQHPNATSEHITKALNDSDPFVRTTAIKHSNATSEHITKALNDNNSVVRASAFKNHNATSEHITKALNDSDPDVRKVAIQHPKATSDHINKALNDIRWSVRASAIEHPNATSEHITKALNDSDPDVRATAIKHPNATSEHITKALNDTHWSVRASAIEHPKATSEHINKALNDSDWSVSKVARRIKSNNGVK
jgi:predicted secreted Zn-dependent protease